MELVPSTTFPTRYYPTGLGFRIGEALRSHAQFLDLISPTFDDRKERLGNVHPYFVHKQEAERGGSGSGTGQN